MRYKFDSRKSEKLKRNPRRGIDFIEVQQLWETPYYLDQCSESPEQFRAVGWINGSLYTVIFEIRRDNEGEYTHLVTLWKSTRQEIKLYEETQKKQTYFS